MDYLYKIPMPKHKKLTMSTRFAPTKKNYHKKFIKHFPLKMTLVL